MTELLDETVSVREGEALNLAALEPYLREHLGLPHGGFTVEQFPGGHSNLTYCVRIGDREFVLRRPPFGSKVKSAHDMGREYTVLKHLQGHFAPAPNPYLYCEDESVIGAKFYLMDRIRGVVLRTHKPAGFEAPPELVRSTCIAMAETLADLHAVDWQAAGLGSLQRKSGTFVRRQVEGWIRRYGDSQTDEVPHVEDVFAWCAQRIPKDVGAVLIHNDYKFDNVLLDPEKLDAIRGVLDWEMSTIGDPLFDLGVALGYWINPDETSGPLVSGCFLTQMPGAVSRNEFADVYGARSGRDVSNIHFYYVFAIIKLAVVLQQIYYRYHQGLTQDERFAPLIGMVHLLAERAANLIDADSL